jgi:hypothetical protein
MSWSLLCVVLFVSASVCQANLGTCSSTGLFTELSTDPKALGYAPAYGGPITAGSVGNDAAVVDALNLPRTAAEYKINRGLMRGTQFQPLINFNEWTALTDLQLQQIQTIWGMGNGSVDVTATGTQRIVIGMFPANGPTYNAFYAYISRDGSRMEVLCGAGTVAVQSDVSCAIRGAC